MDDHKRKLSKIGEQGKVGIDQDSVRIRNRCNFECMLRPGSRLHGEHATLVAAGARPVWLHTGIEWRPLEQTAVLGVLPDLCINMHEVRASASFAQFVAPELTLEHGRIASDQMRELLGRRVLVDTSNFRLGCYEINSY
eukprot:210467-Pyramimonas_sp.AAC.1